MSCGLFIDANLKPVSGVAHLAHQMKNRSVPECIFVSRQTFTKTGDSLPTLRIFKAVASRGV
jgi:hypothetical protein